VVRDFAFGHPTPGRQTADFEKGASLAVLYTHGDTRMDWMRAGMALQRVLLAATARDVACSLLTQALEVTALRRLLRVPSMGVVEPQVLLRLGYGVPAPASRRRPVHDVLDLP
jgi:Nitroreductase family